MVKRMAIAVTEREADESTPIPTDEGSSADAGAGAPTTLNGPQVVDRVVDILEAFLWLGPQLGVSELSRALGLKKATTHRLLGSLRRRDFVAQDPITRRYRLGIKLWELGSRATSQIGWVDRAQPFLQQLTDQTGETAHLAVLDDGEVLYIDKVESTHSLRMPSQVGRRLPAHCTGVGKALLAHLPAVDVASIMTRRGMARFTHHTITNLGALQADLTEVRRRGYSIDDEEIEDGLRCIGAPVRDHSGRVVAAVSIAGPASRLPDSDLPRQGALVLAATRAISTALGCPPQYLDLAHPDGAARVHPPRAVRARVAAE
jgi:DNA-binding IclR family transcriptional regulator